MIGIFLALVLMTERYVRIDITTMGGHEESLTRRV